MERYNRQIILPELGEKGQQRLQQAKVLIVGVRGIIRIHMVYHRNEADAPLHDSYRPVSVSS